jgi:hypothetical protein
MREGSLKLYLYQRRQACQALASKGSTTGRRTDEPLQQQTNKRRMGQIT